jgi:hypothetical protein
MAALRATLAIVVIDISVEVLGSREVGKVEAVSTMATAVCCFQFFLC